MSGNFISGGVRATLRTRTRGGMLSGHLRRNACSPARALAAGYAIGNIVSSVALVLLNKQVFKGGFNFPMTLTAFHFVFTIFFYEMLRYAGAFTRPSPDLPQIEKFKVGLAGFASIGFMNLSLKFNSVGFYQVAGACPSGVAPEPAAARAPVSPPTAAHSLSGRREQCSLPPAGLLLPAAHRPPQSLLAQPAR